MGVILFMGLGVLSPLPFFYAFVIVPRRRARILKERGVTVVGECVSTSWDENASISTIRYRGAAGARSIHRTPPNHGMPIAEGAAVELVYDPLNPGRVQLRRWLDGEPGQSFTNRSMWVIEGVFLIPQLLWVYVILYNIF